MTAFTRFVLKIDRLTLNFAGEKAHPLWVVNNNTRNTNFRRYSLAQVLVGYWSKWLRLQPLSDELQFSLPIYRKLYITDSLENLAFYFSQKFVNSGQFLLCPVLLVQWWDFRISPTIVMQVLVSSVMTLLDDNSAVLRHGVLTSFWAWSRRSFWWDLFHRHVGKQYAAVGLPLAPLFPELFLESASAYICFYLS